MQKIMKRKLVLTFALSLLLVTAWGQSFTIMTYNIRYDNPKDGPDAWEHRKQDMVAFISSGNPMIFGIQEGLFHQVDFLDSNLELYDYTGVGRDDGEKAGEFSAIFYQPAKFELLESGTFWLSETPDQVSVGWDASMERICSFGLFREKGTGKTLWVFNTHFDHRGPLARKNSAKLITEKISEINKDKHPLVLMGDFNATPEEDPIQILSAFLEDGLENSEQPLSGAEGTNIGFRGKQEVRRIDYIFIEDITVENYAHPEPKTRQGRNLSDHLPVTANISLGR
ncbi:MAG: endonuclease [Cyclobacteriaceae bacterium]|nr:MAG: endonuclease [Cyclobacteriaceae bacterium]